MVQHPDPASASGVHERMKDAAGTVNEIATLPRYPPIRLSVPYDSDAIGLAVSGRENFPAGTLLLCYNARVRCNVQDYTNRLGFQMWR